MIKSPFIITLLSADNLSKRNCPAAITSNGFRAGAVFTLRLQKPFNKDNDFNFDINQLRLAFKDRLQPTICPRDAREGAKEKLSPLPCVRRS